MKICDDSFIFISRYLIIVMLAIISIILFFPSLGWSYRLWDKLGKYMFDNWE